MVLTCIVLGFKVGVDVKALKRKLEESVSATEQAKRFRAMMDIYTDDDGTPRIMSDITASIEVTGGRGLS